MIARWFAALVLCAACAANLNLFMGQAASQELVVTLSTREVAVTSNFSGADVAVFGLIERDLRTVTRASPFDVVITVQGPAGDVLMHNKTRFGPIWLTASRRRFSNIPLYFSTLSARPVADIGDSTQAARLKLSLLHYLPEIPALNAEQELEEASYRDALLRIRAKEGAWTVDPSAVTMVRPNLFTAKISLPGKAPTGLYLVNIAVLSEGILLRQTQSGFVVRKVGFDAAIADAAKATPWLYALLTILMAILLGWTANLIFRKE
ncbi:Conserved hypothetical protein CHP02186-related, transmembrane [Rhabdaerophilaceae bacterium]